MRENRIHNLPYEKVGKNEPVCIADEVPFEIPESWEWARWGTLSESIQYGYNAPAQESGRIKMVRISDIQDNSVMWESVPYCDIKECEIDAYLLKPNDILFARTGGTVGKSYLVQEVPEAAIYAGYLIRTRYSGQLCPQYLKYFMESELYWSQLREGTIATAQPNCNGKTLGNMLVPIPPMQEQIRIVEKLNVIMAYVMEYSVVHTKSKQLHNIFPDQLKKSILQEAVQGRLVPQDENDEPASVLLERIRAEKEALIKAGKIKRDKHESVIFRRDNSHYEKFDDVENCIDNELAFEIPYSWCWSRLGSCLDVRDGTHDTPKYVTNGIPLVTSKNLSNGKLDFSTAKFISEDDHIAISQRSKVDNGDIMYAMIGSIGNPVLYYGNDKFSIKNMALFKKINNGLLMEYVYWFLFFSQDNMKKYASGGVQSFVSLNYLRNYLIPIPPIQEQKRIVSAIEYLLPLIDTL